MPATDSAAATGILDPAPEPSLPTRPLERMLRLFSDVREGEGPRLLALTLNVFLILVAYYLMKPVREVLILAQPGGAELKSYVAQGFKAVKMRVGAMDGHIVASLDRVDTARDAIGNLIDLMVDAHGTMSVGQAKQFCHEASDLNLRFIEEPVMSDDRSGLAEVRAASSTPVAAGESEFSRFDFAELIDRRAVDVLQPDLAIAGGFSEGLRIMALCEAHRVELAPHCWGSAISFQAGLTLAFASSSGVYMEVPMGGDPLLREMASITLELKDGMLAPPAGPGWGVDPDPQFVRRYAQGRGARSGE